MAKTTTETGFTGLIEYHGIIHEDFLKEFHGQQAIKRYNEMRLNNATIGAGLLAIEYMLRSMSWNFASDDKNDPQLEFVNEARNGMSQSWNDMISDAVSMVWAGYAIQEIVYKRDDSGRLMWRKFAPRAQDTVYQWLFDDNGGLGGVRQLSAPKFKAVDIPIEKMILYRTRSEKNNPEGRSLLRIAWVSYYYLKNLQATEAIGFERDVTGMPKITLPQGADTNDNSTDSDAGKAAQIVRNVRVDEQAGIVLPFGWEFELLSGAGKSFSELAAAIERYEKRIATSFFSQFLLLGQDGVGSLALSENSTDFFLSAVNAIADIISETFTKFAVYRLLKLNGATDEEANRVKLEHTPAANVDITKIGTFLQSVKELLTIDENDELWIRQLAGMPERDPEELKAERGEIAKQKAEAAKAFAQRVSQGDKAEGKEEEDKKGKFDVYASDPLDVKKREQLEKQFNAVMTTFFEEQRKRMMRKAREMKNANTV